MRIYESMTSFTFAGWRIRVWREEHTLEAQYPNTKAELRKVIDDHMSNNLGLLIQDRIPELVNMLGNVPRVSAVEAVDNGCGIILYPDWP